MENPDEKISELQKIIDTHDHIVFFGGAGVSTESGVPDFRSDNGIYRKKYKNYPVEYMLSHSFYEDHPDDFWSFYKDFFLSMDPDPNPAHYKLAEMEEKGKLDCVITQNIDGLHQKAGSKNVFELHGSTLRNYCTRCHRFFDADYVKKADGIPKCDECGGKIKPDVVLYEESLNDKTIEGAVDAIAKADVLIIGGTSLVVYPAAGLINYFRGSRLVLINKSETSRDSQADLRINGPIGQVMSRIRI
ncbi:MAG: NAD-dependent protein deacylase [Lachnospiraceae bacterium]|jgi:NAD-dependent deacetylase|nr:NAD-dependent protein deacylase [Lachnospiraceae bacterium]MEE3460804.1 NAD-dependent protein deacylase [Lachnospiraceae bacterium]